jgi:DNA-binding beta-propeller fold protein YncE
VANGNGLCLTVIDGKTRASTTLGDVGNGSGDLAVDVLTNQVYVMTANPAGSAVSAFSGANGVFPQSFLNRLMEGVSGIK